MVKGVTYLKLSILRTLAFQTSPSDTHHLIDSALLITTESTNYSCHILILNFKIVPLGFKESCEFVVTAILPHRRGKRTFSHTTNASMPTKTMSSMVEFQGNPSIKIVKFTSPSLIADVCLKIFDTGYHVKSILLKIHSAFFRKFLDSRDKMDSSRACEDFKNSAVQV